MKEALILAGVAVLFYYVGYIHCLTRLIKKAAAKRELL